MNVLEKILEEIERTRKSIIDMSDEEPELVDVEDWFDEGVDQGKLIAYEVVKEIIRSHMDEAKDINVPSNDDWIPVEKKLPEEGQKVLVWYEYFRYGEYNRMFKTYGIGWQFDGHWSGDVSGTKARCIAWQPLPERYR